MPRGGGARAGEQRAGEHSYVKTTPRRHSGEGRPTQGLPLLWAAAGGRGHQRGWRGLVAKARQGPTNKGPTPRPRQAPREAKASVGAALADTQSPASLAGKYMRENQPPEGGWCRAETQCGMRRLGP